MYGTISFPGLGLSFNPSRVAFSIGNKPIYWYVDDERESDCTR